MIVRPVPAFVARAAAAVGVLLAAQAAPAPAHVSIRPPSVAAGSASTSLSFHVPNERSDAGTTSVAVVLPAGHSFSTVEAAAAPGWSAETAEAAGSVTRVTWTGGPITGEDAVDFGLTLGPLPPDATTLQFKVLQTYDSGEVVRWIEPARPDGSEPEHPAALLELAAADAATDGRTSPPPSAEPVRAPQPVLDTPSGVLRTVAGLGVLAAAAVAVLLRRRRRRPTR